MRPSHENMHLLQLPDVNYKLYSDQLYGIQINNADIAVRGAAGFRTAVQNWWEGNSYYIRHTGKLNHAIPRLSRRSHGYNYTFWFPFQNISVNMKYITNRS